MRIWILEPFGSGSHQQWIDGLICHSRHQIIPLTLPGRRWKWRMHGGAVTLARRALEMATNTTPPDLLLASDMLDLAVFQGLTRRQLAHIPTAVYFHENQITYPWSQHDPDRALARDRHYGFINFTTALAADQIWFNSAFHRNSFLAKLPDFLAGFPDYQEKKSVATIAARSAVLHLGMQLKPLDTGAGTPKSFAEPLLLWNHRWEYDKNPELFFESLFQLAHEQHPFKLAMLGQRHRYVPPVFQAAEKRLADRIVQWGPVESRAAYAHWLHQADILPVTSQQDFFGGSVVEATYANVFPLLPRRLAYPEHLTSAACFYESDTDFLPRLRELLQSGAWRGKSFRDAVAKYDWTCCIDIYDQQLESVPLKFAAGGSRTAR